MLNFCRVSWPNGSWYKGEWENGFFHGSGLFSSSSGQLFIGSFEVFVIIYFAIVKHYV